MVNIPELEKQLTDDTDLLSHRAEVFRSKLIADFHLLDTITETGGQQEPPKFYTNDFMDPAQLKKIMKIPNSLVRFQVYSNKGEKQTTDRRNNRVKNRNNKNPPLDLWAHWIVESSVFQNFILGLILINCVVLGIQGEMNGLEERWVDKVKLTLEIFDYCAMMVYVIEIVLKWIDNFWTFWKNRWNIFDFLVTFLFFVPEIINFSTGEWGKESGRSQLTIIANNLRTFRILRSLKMVSRFQKVRLIVLAVTKAFQAMVFITVLFFIFAFIFAIIGVMFFRDSYENYAHFEELYYPDSFEGLGYALVTLFQLFTLDHWLQVYQDLCAISASSVFPAIYVIFWIVVGSFIFRNIFVGIMVNNFQSIRHELFQEVEEIQERERRDQEMQEFAEELDRQTNFRKDSFNLPPDTSQNELREQNEETDDPLADNKDPALGLQKESAGESSVKDDVKERRMSTRERKFSLTPSSRRRESIGIPFAPDTRRESGERQPGIRRDSAALQPGIRRDSAALQPGTRRDSAAQQPGNRRDSVAQKPGNRKDSAVQQAGNRKDSVPQQAGNRKDSVPQQAGGRKDSVAQQPGDRKDSVAQQPGDRKDSVTQEPGNRKESFPFKPRNRQEEAYRRASLQAQHRSHRESISAVGRRDFRKTSLLADTAMCAEYDLDEIPREELRNEISFQVLQAEMESSDWQARIEKNFENLAKEEAYYCWPRDTLFRYFLIMESLQENLHERQDIMKMITEVLLQIHDS